MRVLEPLCQVEKLEISPTQLKAVDYFTEQHLPGKKISFIRDLASWERVVKIQ